MYNMHHSIARVEAAGDHSSSWTQDGWVEVQKGKVGKA
jgi:hypothetical protein